MQIKYCALLAAIALTGGAAQASAAVLTFDTVQFPGTGVPLSVAGSDGETFTFTAGASSQFEAFQSGGGGSFPQGTFFLAPGLGNTTPINVAFSAPIYAIQIPVASDRVGDSPYTSTVQFYSGANLVGSSTQNGNAMDPAQLFSFNQAITSAVISTLANSPFGYTQNIGPITYSVSATPIPPALLMFGTALLGLGAVGVKRRKALRRTSDHAPMSIA
jgi:hypothetical protein